MAPTNPHRNFPPPSLEARVFQGLFGAVPYAQEVSPQAKTRQDPEARRDSGSYATRGHPGGGASLTPLLPYSLRVHSARQILRLRLQGRGVRGEGRGGG